MSSWRDFQRSIDLRLGTLKREAEAVFGFPGGIEYLLNHGLHADICARELCVLEQRVREERLRHGVSEW